MFPVQGRAGRKRGGNVVSTLRLTSKHMFTLKVWFCVTVHLFNEIFKRNNLKEFLFVWLLHRW